MTKLIEVVRKMLKENVQTNKKCSHFHIHEITFKTPSNQCSSAAFKNNFLVQYKSQGFFCMCVKNMQVVL